QECCSPFTNASGTILNIGAGIGTTPIGDPVPVPGPIVGGGIPGFLALLGYFGWRRRAWLRLTAAAYFECGRAARSDLCRRWPSRLVATAAEGCLSFRQRTVVCGTRRLPDFPGSGGDPRQSRSWSWRWSSEVRPPGECRAARNLHRRAFGSTTLIVKTYRCANPSWVITRTSRLSAPRIREPLGRLAQALG